MAESSVHFGATHLYDHHPYILDPEPLYVYIGQVYDDHTFIAWKHETLLLVPLLWGTGRSGRSYFLKELKTWAGEKRNRCVRFNNKRLKQWVITASRECGKKWLSFGFWFWWKHCFQTGHCDKRDVGRYFQVQPAGQVNKRRAQGGPEAWVDQFGQAEG